VRNTELLVRQAMFSRTSRQGHVCSPRRPRAGLDSHGNIAAARKAGNVCSSAMEFAIATGLRMSIDLRNPFILALTKTGGAFPWP
jgi:hypothetical protein